MWGLVSSTTPRVGPSLVFGAAQAAGTDAPIHPSAWNRNSRKFTPLGNARRIQRYVLQDDKLALERGCLCCLAKVVGKMYEGKSTQGQS